MEKVHQEQSTNIAYQITILAFIFLKSWFTVLSGITASECYWDIIYAVLGVTLPPPHATLSHRSGEAKGCLRPSLSYPQKIYSDGYSCWLSFLLGKFWDILVSMPSVSSHSEDQRGSILIFSVLFIFIFILKHMFLYCAPILKQQTPSLQESSKKERNQ